MAHVDVADRVRLHGRQCHNGVVVRPDLANLSNALPAFLSVDNLEALGDVPRHNLTVNRPTYDNLSCRLHRDLSDTFLYITCQKGAGAE